MGDMKFGNCNSAMEELLRINLKLTPQLDDIDVHKHCHTSVKPTKALCEIGYVKLCKWGDCMELGRQAKWDCHRVFVGTGLREKLTGLHAVCREVVSELEDCLSPYTMGGWRARHMQTNSGETSHNCCKDNSVLLPNWCWMDLPTYLIVSHWSLYLCRNPTKCHQFLPSKHDPF